MATFFVSSDVNWCHVQQIETKLAEIKQINGNCENKW